MDRSKVREIVQARIHELIRDLAIGHWRLMIEYENKPPDSNGVTERGDCVRLVDYNRATINLNPDAFSDDDETKVFGVLRHELLHVVLAPFDIFLNVVSPLIEDDPVKTKVIQSVWDHAVEQAVVNLERIHDQLTPEPETKPMAVDKVKGGFKNETKDGKAMSKKPLTKADANAQDRAIQASKAAKAAKGKGGK